MYSNSPPSFKHKIFNALLIIAAACLVLFSLNVLTQAQGSEGSAGAGDSGGSGPAAAPAPDPCVAYMTIYMNTKAAELGAFFNTHFRREEPASRLIPEAVNRMRQYRENAMQELADMNVPRPGQTLTEPVAANPECEKIIEEKYTVMEAVLRSHIMANAMAKKTMSLQNKYKELNGRMRKLNMTIGQMAGFFYSFANQLPCYPKQCTKG